MVTSYSLKNRNYNEYLMVLAIFMIMPLAGIICCALAICLKTHIRESHLYFLALLIALYLSGINATKLFESDQLGYADMYMAVPKYGLNDFLYTYHYNDYEQDTYKEFGFRLYCYLIYYPTLGNAYLYFTVTTFLIYKLIFDSIIKFFLKFRRDTPTIICSIFVAAFFFQFFNETAHAIRQMMAGSLLLYAIVKKSLDGKNHWLYLFFAITIHISSLFFVVLYFLPNNILLNKKIFWSFLCIIAALTFSMVGIAQYFLNAADGAVQVSYVGDELDEWKGLSAFILLFFIMPLLVILYINLQKRNIVVGVRYFLSIAACLLVFILSCVHNTLIQGRFIFYLYAFIPFVFPLAFKTTSPYNRYYCFSLSILMLLYFLSSFPGCIWHYAELWKLLLYPYPFLLFYNI